MHVPHSQVLLTIATRSPQLVLGPEEEGRTAGGRGEEDGEGVWLLR